MSKSRVVFYLCFIMIYGFVMNEKVRAQKSKSLSNISMSVHFLNDPPMKRSFWGIGKLSLEVKVNLVNKTGGFIWIEDPVLGWNLHVDVVNRLGESVVENIPPNIDPIVSDELYRKLKTDESHTIELDLLDQLSISVEKGKTYQVVVIYNPVIPEFQESVNRRYFKERIVTKEEICN